MANYANQFLFDYIDNILLKKSNALYEKHIADEKFEKTFPRFMVLRYLSMAKPEVARVAMDFQVSIERFPSNRILYKALINAIPKQTSGFVRYIK